MWDTLTTAKTLTWPHKTLDWAADWTLLCTCTDTMQNVSAADNLILAVNI